MGSHHSKCGWKRQQPSTNRTVKAQSTKPLSLKKPLTNEPPRPPQSILTEPNRPLLGDVEKYQTDRPRTAATTTEANRYPPLSSIGQYQIDRPRTAASTKTSKVGFPETGRPVTSHAAIKNQSFAHCGGEASSNVSPAAADKSSACSPYLANPRHLDDSAHPAFRGGLESDNSSDSPYPARPHPDDNAPSNILPAATGFKSPQPKNSTLSPYLAKPRHLDDGAHPAFRGGLENNNSSYSPYPADDGAPPPYREVLESGNNAYQCITKQNTELSSIHRSPHSDQLRSQFKEKPGAANTSVIPAPEPKFNVSPPPPPLPSKAKHSLPSHMVSSGPSSSLRRDQQPSHYTYDDQRRAVIDEPPWPQLPPRPPITESLQSSGSSTRAATLDTSKRSSDANTVFMNMEPRTAIATPKFDFSSFLSSGRKFGVD